MSQVQISHPHLHRNWKENTITSMFDMQFELTLDNVSALLQPPYERAIIIPKKKVTPNVLKEFTSELHKVMPVLNEISDEELEKIIDRSFDDAED